MVEISSNNFDLVEAIQTETIELLIELQRYYPNQLRIDTSFLPSVDHLKIQGEASRVMSRLVWLTAWAGVQFALKAGEPVAEDDRVTLDGPQGDCLISESDLADVPVPARLRSLLDRSLNLILYV